MFLDDREQAVLEEVRRFLRDEVTPDLVAESLYDELLYGGQLGRRFVRKFAQRGWLVPTLPGEYGGLESPPMLADFLPRLARGEIELALSYSEPGAGLARMDKCLIAAEPAGWPG